MNKKGFTLVELLAVIVILAIIAIITIPMIKGVIDKVKMKSLEDSVYGLKSAAELYYSSNEKVETTEFICNDNGCLSDSGKKLDYKGKVEGKVKLFSDGKVSICLTSDNYASSILASDKKATTKMGGCDEETYEISEVIAIEKYNKVNSDYLLVKNTLYNKTLISNINNDANTISQEINNIDLNQGEAANKKTIVEGLQYSELGITEDMSWNEIKEKLLQKFPEWDGDIFSNGAFSPKQPITAYSVSKSNQNGSSTYGAPRVSINNLKLTLYTGVVLNGYVQTMFVSDKKINFDIGNFSSFTIKGTMYHWESIATWQLGFCDDIPSSYAFDSSVTTKTISSNSSVSTGTETFNITFPIENITGEKYLCIRGTTSGHAERHSTLYIESIQFDK